MAVLKYWSGAAWITILGGVGGGGIEEAPQDGKLYARQNGAWVEIQAIGTPTEAFEYDDGTQAQFDDGSLVQPI